MGLLATAARPQQRVQHHQRNSPGGCRKAAGSCRKMQKAAERCGKLRKSCRACRVLQLFAVVRALPR
eukprot:5675971-Alexandrium_andersonii.AAC.1